jgi:hypothetical protein
MKKQVEGHPGLVKDISTGVVLNMNRSEIESAKARKKARKEQEQELSDLKKEMGDLKDMMKRILEKL